MTQGNVFTESKILGDDPFRGDLSLKVRLLELSHVIHGQEAAARLWDKFKMSQIIGELTASNWRGRPLFCAFLSDRCIESLGHRVQSSVLYREFVDWSREKGIAPCSQKAFSIGLRGSGVLRRNSHFTWFLDIKLKGTSKHRRCASPP
jgi:hypothetical protein